MKQNTNGKVRILSLDFFRGLTIAGMILVNTPGDGDYVYAPLKHSVWHGCTPTDLVFPFFLFMVGVSIVYALSTKKLDVNNHNTIILGALRRMLILIGLGLSIFLFASFDFTHLRFPGVLQRIGIVYFISTIIYLKSTQRTRDWLFGIILVTYYLLLTFVPIPDGHAPNLTPHNNLAAWLDRAIFTTNHMYRHTVYWDPVGLLSTLPAIATALFGIRVGELLKRKDISVNKICSTLLIVGIVATVLGLLADFVFPINKQLWTSSYVLYTGGLCTIGLTAAYWVIDVKGYKKYVWIFVVFGTNAISAYVLSEYMPGIIDSIKFHKNDSSIGGMRYIYETVFAPHFSAINASLFCALAFVLFIWLIMYFMYRKNIIIKV
jgi:predicted acyltransferase